MKFRQLIGHLGRPVDRAEAVDAIRAEHGKGARAWLAEKYGVTRDTAGRWLSGKQTPSRDKGGEGALRGSANPNRVAAQAIRNAQSVNVGKVKVIVKSPGTTSSRNLGMLDVSPEMRAELDRAAALLEAGDVEGSDAAMKAAILGEYGARHGRNRDSMRSVMDVEDWTDGMDIY